MSDVPAAGQTTRTIRLLLEYDGTPFHGWQLQPRSPTVQEVLERALERLTGQRPRVKGSGRTDAGVHALGQVASFSTGSGLPVDVFRRGLNALLPDAVSILAAKEAPPGFDAQFSAIGKLYRYRVINRDSPSPLELRRSWHVGVALDRESIEESARIILGTHDFSSFRGTGCVASSPVRSLRRCAVEISGDIICFELEADGFLRHMVRNIVGTLIEVGRRRFSTDDFAAILKARDRRCAGVAAPPQGLYLVRVDYPPEIGGWQAPEAHPRRP
jgi:tRNA pseudouridine38-40 synthase